MAQVANIEQFKSEVLHFIDYALKNNDSISVTTCNSTVVFTREPSDQEYIESIPNLKEDILAASKEIRTKGGRKLNLNSFEEFDSDTGKLE